MSTIERVEVEQMDRARFIADCVVPGRPVIIVGAMREWAPPAAWTPAALVERFGDERAQFYGDLFRLVGTGTLREYVARHMKDDPEGPPPRAGSVPYLRWYCRLAADERVPWADDVFERLRADWDRPSFFPEGDFALPFCPPGAELDPTRDWFPSRGLFISGRGARTRLHRDPWCSDALLCQVHGEKTFGLYPPSEGQWLEREGRCVDLDSPDAVAFPDHARALPFAEDRLRPGEIVFIPSGWYHYFASPTHSVSLTWNFVHASRVEAYASYLEGAASAAELAQLTYAYGAAPTRHALPAEHKVAHLLDIARSRP